MSQPNLFTTNSIFGNAPSGTPTSQPHTNTTSSPFATTGSTQGLFNSGAAHTSSQPGGSLFATASSRVQPSNLFSSSNAAQSFDRPTAGAVSQPSRADGQPGLFGNPRPLFPIRKRNAKSSERELPALQSEGMLLANLFTSPTIIVHFSCNKREYHLHQTVLKSKSVYFKSMLDSGLRESCASEVTFDWPQPFERAFRLVIDFLYTGQYDTGNAAVVPVLSGPLPNSVCGPKCQPLAYHLHIYLIADRLMMPDLKQVAMAKFLALWCPGAAYAICPSKVPWLVDILYCNAIDREDAADQKDDASDADASTSGEKSAEGAEDATVPKTAADGNKVDTSANPTNDTDANEIVDDDDDGPLRDIQKTFTRLFNQHIAISWRKDRRIQKAIFDVPQFALDIFVLGGEQA